jgi:hypothetical protein
MFTIRLLTRRWIVSVAGALPIVDDIIPALCFNNSGARKSDIIDLKHILHYRPLILGINKAMEVTVEVLFEEVMGRFSTRC